VYVNGWLPETRGLRMIAAAAERLGRPASLWDVFMTHTGRSLDDDIAEDAEEAIS
jgi:hypothetical protein